MDRHEKFLVRCLIVCLALALLGPTIKLFAGLAYHLGWG